MTGVRSCFVLVGSRGSRGSDPGRCAVNHTVAHSLAQRSNMLCKCFVHVHESRCPKYTFVLIPVNHALHVRPYITAANLNEHVSAVCMHVVTSPDGCVCFALRGFSVST